MSFDHGMSAFLTPLPRCWCRTRAQALPCLTPQGWASRGLATRTARREAGYLAGSSPGLETLHSDMSEHLLDTQHAEQLVEYLRFLRRKRDQCVSEIAAEFKELLQSRLLEDQRTPMLHTRRHGPRSAPGPPEGCSQRQLTLPPQAGPITRAPAGRVGAGWPYSAWLGHRYTPG